MSSATLISVGEYLASSYRPDRDYVDGQVVERNVGEWDHSRLQLRLGSYLLVHYETTLGLIALTEQRVQVKPTRFRIPDITVVRGNPGEQIIKDPPLICIEILSPSDAMPSVQERIDDYLAFGVENVWIVDLRRKKAFWAESSGVQEAVGGLLEAKGAPVRLDMISLWSE